ncbi:Hypothetical predicted protein [Podarcis lilfordi]|uniref:Uncharacterized protein n=1 Tax=Podarcis lilfordi TaxID=74358 RepID=A0AA35JV75_9SAUR|nr:Hypothetical predicted protein [Podarcis lilfordi]
MEGDAASQGLPQLAGSARRSATAGQARRAGEVKVGAPGPRGAKARERAAGGVPAEESGVPVRRKWPIGAGSRASGKS